MKIILPPVIEIPDKKATVELIAELNNRLGVELECLDCREKVMKFRNGTHTVRTFPRNVIVRQPPNPPSVA